MSWEDVLAGTASVGAEPTGAYRHIRHTADGPVGGALTACGDDLVVLAHAAELGDWEGWRHAGAQHVLAPVDLVRLAEGHAVALPLCDIRLDKWIARRATRGPELSGGEIVTIVVSLLRGTQEAWAGRGAEEPGPVGAWWIASDARPLFAHGEGEPVEAAATRAITTIAGSCSDRVVRRVLEEIPPVLIRPRALHRTAPEMEEKLFEACAPRALVLDDPERGTVGYVGADGDDETPNGVDTAALRPRGGALETLIERHLDTGVADLVADAWNSLRGSWGERRVRRRRGEPSTNANGGTGGRRAPLLVGIAAAAVVLVVGVLWPTGDEDGDGAAAARPVESSAPAHGSEVRSQSPAETPQEASAPGGSASEDAAPADEAGADATGSSGETPEQATLRLVDDADESNTTLVDDFGDVAVTRVEAGDTPRHVVLERVDDAWRVRQVYDTAKGAG